MFTRQPWFVAQVISNRQKSQKMFFDEFHTIAIMITFLFVLLLSLLFNNKETVQLYAKTADLLLTYLTEKGLAPTHCLHLLSSNRESFVSHQVLVLKDYQFKLVLVRETMCLSSKFWCWKDKKIIDPVFNRSILLKVLEHQVLVLIGWKIRRSSFQIFLPRYKGLGAPRIGARQPVDLGHQLGKQNLVFKNQNMVFINQINTAS